MNSSRLGLKTIKKKRKRRIFIVILIITILGLGFYIFNFYNNITNTLKEIHEPIAREKSDKREDFVEIGSKDPLSILLVGVDERDGDFGRTDSMLVMTINPIEKSTKILSIPRDTRTELIDSNDPSNNTVDKINHAYAFGGIEMSISSVEQFLNVPIDYYVEINMEGFRDIVNSVGGIDVNNEYAFELDGTYLSEGQQHLNGEEALQYSRMRKEDPRGDFGRQERQREVISKVIDKGVSLSSLTNYNDILDAVKSNIKTNVPLDQMIELPLKYADAVGTIDKLEIEGEEATINDIWYFTVSDETRQSLSDELRVHLELQTDTVAPFSSIEY